MDNDINHIAEGLSKQLNEAKTIDINSLNSIDMSSILKLASNLVKDAKPTNVRPPHEQQKQEISMILQSCRDILIEVTEIKKELVNLQKQNRNITQKKWPLFRSKNNSEDLF
jgi:hypothetical protein